MLRQGLSRHLAQGIDASADDAPASARDEVQEVAEAFQPKTPEASDVPVTGDATLALRDLAVANAKAAGAAGRNAYYAMNQRPWPDDNDAYSEKCRRNTVGSNHVDICVHWLSKDEPAYADNPNAATDKFANQALDTLSYVSTAYMKAGYRTPKPDGPRPDHQPMYGGTSATDIYLANIGPSNLYGYCTADVNDNGTFTYLYQDEGSRRSDLPAFCVLDNDYSPTEFGTRHTYLEDLQVTAAHEYYHAVQFAYDFFEDRWFMEATATWAEDEVYPNVDDNLSYLPSSQLRYPMQSLDNFDAVYGGLHYGDWIYFRYLTERLPAQSGGMPVLVRRMWQYADSVSGPDDYSVQAIAHALRERHVDFNTIFGQYAAANRHPATAYAEGRANHYPSGGPKRTIRLKPSHRTASAEYKVDHLASATVRFIPRSLRPKRTKLTLTVNMANKRSGSVAVALVFTKDGRVSTKMVKLGRTGNGKVRVPFSSRTVARVEIVLANANHAYRHCWSDTPYSCSGVPAHDNVLEKVSARVS